MKLSRLLLISAVFCLPACEKIKNLAGSVGKATPVNEPASAWSGPLVSEIEESAYEKFPYKSGRVVIIDFYADWCGPCRQLGPILDSIAPEHGGKVLVGRVNVDKLKQIAAKEGVNGIPDVRIYREGKLVDQFVGCPDESEVRRRIKAQTEGLPELPAANEATGKAKREEPVAKPMSKDWMPPGLKRR